MTENEHPEGDLVEGVPALERVLNARIAWCAPYHLPTAEEIASRKYVRRRYKPLPCWARRLFGTGEFEPRSSASRNRPAELDVIGEGPDIADPQ